MGISERKKRDNEALQKKVLDAAEEIFIKEGIPQMTMRRIAAKIEYSPTVLYRLFTNKNDLMDHLIARGYHGVRSLYEDVLRRKNLDPLEALIAILQAYTAYALDHPNHYRMWFVTGEIRRENHSLQMSHGRLKYTVFKSWLSSIEACMDTGLLPKGDPMEVFQVLWSKVHGLISLRLQHPDFPWMPVARHLVEVLDLHRKGTKRNS